MDLFLSRQEIRRQACALAGYTSDLALSAQDRARIDAYIDAASLKVAGASRWLSLQRRATVSLPVDTQVISYRGIEEAYWMEQRHPDDYHPGTFGTADDPWYPDDLASYPLANVGPSGIIEVAAWDDLKYEYYTLYKARTNARFEMDRWSDLTSERKLLSQGQGKTTDQVNDDVQAANGKREQTRGRPYSYEPLTDGIHFWPIPNKPESDYRQFVVRVIYTVTPTWQYQYGGMDTTKIDQIQSVVDAQAIIYFVVAQMFAMQGDDAMQTNYLNQFQTRIRELRGWQSTGEVVVADTEAAFDNDYESNVGRQLPNWALGPAIRRN